ncbi:hypothetical protein AQUCO_03500249v1 [Aquilegia coerulea]|uniref:BHLH domain-containing protein n=1 Tax=Aquilegia coerulea TaxID=218851 RepID=A0A2G5CXW4_AQUCA|nr:hypothetical protein AQUCO_03500249v1 [Aquilegia coerulea]
MLLVDPSSECSNPVKVDKLHHRHKRSGYLNCNGEGDKNNDNNKKTKIVHREVERQRRQEMATLYSTLRSLVPHEYLKGKRSISDHMNEAANYVKHQQTKIKELVEERDKLQKMSNSTSDTKKECSSFPNFVNVQASFAGVEIIISSGSRDRGLALSWLLVVLVEEGLSVASCISTKANEITFHTIQAEVINPDDFDLCGLQHKLINLSHSPVPKYLMNHRDYIDLSLAYSRSHP